VLFLGKNAWYGDPEFPHHECEKVYLSPQARRQGTYIIGTTGTGKTTLLVNLIEQDMRAGEGLCVLDPHGDFTYDIIARVPSERLDDVILFDPALIDCPPGLNLFDCDRDNPMTRDLVVSTVIETLYRLFADSWGPRMEDLVRHSILSLLLHDEPTSLVDLMLVLVSEDHRYRLTRRARFLDPILRHYWESDFPEGSGTYERRDRRELVGSSLNKIGRFITNPVIRHIVGQPASSFDLRQIMDEGKILLVNLAKGDIGADNAALLGSVVVHQLLVAALSRRSQPEEERRDFRLYADEFQSFATRTFADLQSEGRKFHIDTVVAHQYRDQLDDLLKGASLNVANLICLRASGIDAAELAGQFENRPGMSSFELKPSPMPVDGDGRFYIQQQLETGEGLYEFAPSKQRYYADVEAETANIIAQLPNYSGLVRVLEEGKNPEWLEQFRVEFEPKSEVAASVAKRRIEYVKQKACERAAFSREEIEAYIKSRTSGGAGDVGLVLPYDTPIPEN